MSRNSRKKATIKRKKMHSRNGNKYLQWDDQGGKTFVSPGRFGGGKKK